MEAPLLGRGGEIQVQLPSEDLGGNVEDPSVAGRDQGGRWSWRSVPSWTGSWRFLDKNEEGSMSRSLGMWEDHSNETWDAGPSFEVVRMASIALVAYLAVGCVIYYFFRDDIGGKQTSFFVDALYFCVVTMTTVGYGDLVPRTAGAKLFVCVLIFLGLALVYLLISAAATYIADKQGAYLARAMKQKKTQLQREAEFSPRVSRIRSWFRDSEINHDEPSPPWVKAGLSLAGSVVCLTLGTGALVFFERMDWVDAFYCAFVSMTTVGYGELSFQTTYGRLFASYWLLGSSVVLAQFFYYLAEASVERRHRRIVHRILSRKPTEQDLHLADIDNDHRVSCAEFVLLKLTQMGKVGFEDIEPLAATFKMLDTDEDNYLMTDEGTDDDNDNDDDDSLTDDATPPSEDCTRTRLPTVAHPKAS